MSTQSCLHAEGLAAWPPRDCSGDSRSSQQNNMRLIFNCFSIVVQGVSCLALLCMTMASSTPAVTTHTQSPRYVDPHPTIPKHSQRALSILKPPCFHDCRSSTMRAPWALLPLWLTGIRLAPTRGPTRWMVFYPSIAFLKWPQPQHP